MENEYVVLLHNLDAGSSALLGEFNAEDNYDISDDIKKELLKSNKLLTEYKSDEIKANAKVGSFSFDFVVYVQLGEEHKKRISLFLKEKCKLGLADKELETYISSVIVEEEHNLLEIVKKEFNIYTIDESSGIDMSNSNLKAILDKKDKVAKRAKFLLTELNGLNKSYVLKMLSLIKASGPYGNQLLFQFKEIIKSQNLDKSKDNYWFALKTVLDKLVTENILLFDDRTKKRMEALQKEYKQAVNNAKEPPQKSKSDKKSKSDDKKKKKKGKGKGDDDSQPTNSSNVGSNNNVSTESKLKPIAIASKPKPAEPLQEEINQSLDNKNFVFLGNEIFDQRMYKNLLRQQKLKADELNKQKADVGRDL